MSEAKNNDAPSADALASIQRYTFLDDGCPEESEHGRWVEHADLPALLARVRREARAEAFEHMGAALRSYGELEFAEHAEALAAKERAK